MNDKAHWIKISLSALLALTAGVWASTQLLPATQALQLDYASSFALTLVVVAALWWRTFQSQHAERAFWQLLALGWSLNLVGNIGWAAHDSLADQPLPIFSWLDAFYLARYLLLFLAALRYSTPWRRPTWLIWSAITLLSGSLIWQFLFRPLLALPETTLAHFWGGAFYIILDIALLTAGVLSGREEPTRKIGVGLAPFTLAMLFYGAANWLNFQTRLVSLAAYSQWAALGWLLADLIIGAAALIQVSERRS